MGSGDISEYCLIREVIWMFNKPRTCKWFLVDNDKIFIKNIKSIPLKKFLESIICLVSKYNDLQNFVENVYVESFNKSIPRTYEFYAASIKKLLQTFIDQLLKIEYDIKMQPKSANIIKFRCHFDEYFNHIEKLHEIHKMVVLDFNSYPAHICSAYLISKLLSSFSSTGCDYTAKLSITLFFTSISLFCEIIDVWWTEGKLDDWKSEFIVEKFSENEYRRRTFEKCKEKCFFVPSNISQAICENSFFQLMLDHSLKAGYILKVLYEINRINQLKNASYFKGSLYKTFMKAFLNEISKFNANKNMEKNSNCQEIHVKKFSRLPFHSKDPFLFNIFNGNLWLDEDLDSIEDHINPAYFMELLENESSNYLPLEESIIKCMRDILDNRISLTNEFIMKIFIDELKIFQHFKNIRSVMLLEYGDLMFSFYSILFSQIESGNQWNNSFALTIKLDEILSSRFNQMSSLFQVLILSNSPHETTKVTEAIEKIEIQYNVSKELMDIINENTIKDYNKVFQFLLKVKWAVWSLENVHFFKYNDRQFVYTELTMLDILMRQLEQLRFWMIYTIQCIHYYLITHVLQTMEGKLNIQFKKCTNLLEIKSVHQSYIDTVLEKCFLTPNYTQIQVGIEQLFNLIYMLQVEWDACVKEIKHDISINESLNNESLNNDSMNNKSMYVTCNQIALLENTYIKCHRYLADVLSNEVYVKQNNHLSELTAAFLCSLPY